MKLNDLLEHVGDCKIHITLWDDRAEPKSHKPTHYAFDCGSDAERSMRDCRAFVNKVYADLALDKSGAGAPMLHIGAELLNPEDQPEGGAK